MSAAGYLLDTHIWVWDLLGSGDLSPELFEKLASSGEDLWLSPISVWELGLLVAKGRFEVEGAFRDWVTEAMARRPLRPAPLTHEVALASLEVEIPQRDPADRFLAATALVYDLTLITADRHLLASPAVPTA